jgi:hypothetical protein
MKGFYTGQGYLVVIVVALCTLLPLNNLWTQDLLINEVLASNASGIVDEDGDHEDWIEIYNRTDGDIDLTGYGLSDDYDRPYRWIFPDNTIIRAGEYMLVWASGKDRGDEYLHTNFAISSSGEEILLTDPQGQMVDQIAPVPIPTGVSYGRKVGNEQELVYFDEPTPGAPNHSDYYTGISQPPIFSISGGFFDESFELELISPDPEAEIIFTTDGSQPAAAHLEPYSYSYKNQYIKHPGQQSGPLFYDSIETFFYQAPIEIADRTSQPNRTSQKSSSWDQTPHYLPDFSLLKGTVVRAKTIKDGYLPSEVISESYYVFPEGRDMFSLPVLSLSTAENHLFDYYHGIYTAGIDFEEWRDRNPFYDMQGFGYPANWKRRTEFPVSIQYYEIAEEKPIVNQNAGMRIHGGWSRSNPLKNIRLYARGQYDRLGEFHYPFMQGALDQNGEVIDEYKRLLIRAGGNTNKILRDAVRHLIMEPGHAGVQNSQPIVHFINGEYWGIANIRERIDKYYLASKYHVDPENLIIINSPYGEGHSGMVDEGYPEDILKYRQFYHFLRAHDFSKDEQFSELEDRIDVLGFMDYNIMFIYLNNRDWSGIKHFRYWKVRETGPGKYEDGKWRFIIWDFDSQEDADYDFLVEFINPDGHSGDSETTFILRTLLKNKPFKDLFLNRFSDHMNTTFHVNRVDELARNRYSEIESELTRHFNRWRHHASQESELQWFYDFAKDRPFHMRNQLREHLNAGDDAHLTVDVSDPEHGYIRVNTIDIHEHTEGVQKPVYPWSGVYFDNVAVKLKAIPNDNYYFSHWEGIEDSLNPEPVVLITDSLKVKAHFFGSGRPESELLYFWTFDSDLPNNHPLEYVEPTYALGDFGRIEFQSALVGYPFFQNHPLWRKASMERRNRPTSLNYFPEGNSGTPYSEADLRALQIRQPFVVDSRRNELYLHFSTEGYRNIEVGFAVMDEGATEEIHFELEKLNEQGNWTSLPFDFEPVILTDEYQLVQWDFHLVEEVNNHPSVRLNITFSGEDLHLDAGNRTTFHNFTVHGNEHRTDEAGPEQVKDFETINLIARGDVWSLDFSDYFQHPENGEIYFSVTPDREGIIQTQYNQSALDFYPLETGETLIAVRAYDWKTTPAVDTFAVVVHPEAVNLAERNYYFDNWSSDSDFMTYPEHMIFLQTDESHPDDKTVTTRAYPSDSDILPENLPYQRNSGSRVTGLGDRGVSMMNDNTSRGIAGAAISVDSRDVEYLYLRYLLETIEVNEVAYGLKIQYRTDLSEPFEDLVIQDLDLTFDSDNNTDIERFGYFPLPDFLKGEKFLQLMWRFYPLDPPETYGKGAEIRLDEIALINSEVEIETGDCAQPFPNPATEEIYVFGKWGGSQAKIFDVKGQLMRESNLPPGLHSVSIRDFSPGIYFLIIDGDHQKCRYKFIKQ